MTGEIINTFNQQPEGSKQGLIVFQPQSAGMEIDLYHQTADLDQKALILNRDIVRVEEATATLDSVRMVAMIVSEQHRQRPQYRSDAVAGLSPDNLMAMINGVASGDREEAAAVLSTMNRIQQIGDRVVFNQAGIDSPRQSSQTNDEEIETLKDELMRELAERLIDNKFDPDERSRQISAVDGMVTSSTLKAISERGDVLEAFLVSKAEFRNSGLRAALHEIQENLDLQ